MQSSLHLQDIEMDGHGGPIAIFLLNQRPLYGKAITTDACSSDFDSNPYLTWLNNVIVILPLKNAIISEFPTKVYRQSVTVV